MREGLTLDEVIERSGVEPTGTETLAEYIHRVGEPARVADDVLASVVDAFHERVEGEDSSVSDEAQAAIDQFLEEIGPAPSDSSDPAPDDAVDDGADEAEAQDESAADVADDVSDDAEASEADDDREALEDDDETAAEEAEVEPEGERGDEARYSEDPVDEEITDDAEADGPATADDDPDTTADVDDSPADEDSDDPDGAAVEADADDDLDHGPADDEETGTEPAAADDDVDEPGFEYPGTADTESDADGTADAGSDADGTVGAATTTGARGTADAAAAPDAATAETDVLPTVRADRGASLDSNVIEYEALKQAYEAPPSRPRRTVEVDPSVLLAAGIGLVAAVAVVVAYLLRGGRPPQAAMLVQTATHVSANGYLLPATVPYVPGVAIPLVEPPLVVYAMALLADVTGADAGALALGLRLVAHVLWAGACFALARELLDDPVPAGVATAVAAASPVVFAAHLGAGGAASATAFLLAFVAVYCSYRLVTTVRVAARPTFLAAAAASFGLVVLVQLEAALYVLLAIVALVLGYDRSSRGVLSAFIVVVGGLVVSLPWWVLTASRHGKAAFATAIGPVDVVANVGTALWPLAAPTVDPVLLVVWYGAALGLVSELRDGRWFLPAWLGLSAVLLGAEPRYLFPILAVLFVAGLYQFAIPLGRSAGLSADAELTVRAAVAVVLVLGVASVGVVAAQTAMPAADYDARDVAAMDWVRTETPEGATFVVVRGPESFLPAQGERATLVRPWDGPGEGPAELRRHAAVQAQLDGCNTPDCVTSVFARAGLDPDYVYFGRPIAHEPFEASDRFERVYREGWVSIYAVD